MAGVSVLVVIFWFFFSCMQELLCPYARFDLLCMRTRGGDAFVFLLLLVVVKASSH